MVGECFEKRCYKCFYKDVCNKDYDNPLQKIPSWMAGTKLFFRDKEKAEKELRPPRRKSYAELENERYLNALHNIGGHGRWGGSDDW